jgi:hypothetical protein
MPKYPIIHGVSLSIEELQAHPDRSAIRDAFNAGFRQTMEVARGALDADQFMKLSDACCLSENPFPHEPPPSS